jgi:hypothetical protein
MVICDQALSVALQAKALHLSQIREKVCQQLVSISNPNLLTPFVVSPTPAIPVITPCIHPEGRPKTIRERPSIVPLDYPVLPNELFRITPELQRVFDSLQRYEEGTTVFRYKHISKLLSGYLLTNKSSFFDKRNIAVAIIEGSLLEEAFKVKCLHRSQVMTLVVQCLIPLPIDEQDDFSGPHVYTEPEVAVPAPDSGEEDGTQNTESGFFEE